MFHKSHWISSVSWNGTYKKVRKRNQKIKFYRMSLVILKVFVLPDEVAGKENEQVCCQDI